MIIYKMFCHMLSRTKNSKKLSCNSTGVCIIENLNYQDTCVFNFWNSGTCFLIKTTMEAKPLIFEVHGRNWYMQLYTFLIRTKGHFHHPEGAASDGWEQQELQNRDPLPLRRWGRFWSRCFRWRAAAVWRRPSSRTSCQRRTGPLRTEPSVDPAAGGGYCISS